MLSQPPPATRRWGAWALPCRSRDAECARCAACRERRRLDPELVRVLGLKVKPWQFEIGDFPDVVAALNEAGAGNGSERPRLIVIR
jgi:hypothetical protein